MIKKSIVCFGRPLWFINLGISLLCTALSTGLKTTLWESTSWKHPFKDAATSDFSIGAFVFLCAWTSSTTLTVVLPCVIELVVYEGRSGRFLFEKHS